MANVNPGQSLTSATSAGAGTAIDMMGAATGVAGIGRTGLHVEVSGYAATSQVADVVASNPHFTVGLEVSMDNSNWSRIAVVNGNGNTPANTALTAQGVFLCRYARATLDALDTRITAITVNAWVTGSSG